jgi:hypothetical protein
MVARTIIGTCPTPDVCKSRHTPINFDNRMLDPLMAALLMGVTRSDGRRQQWVCIPYIIGYICCMHDVCGIHGCM